MALILFVASSLQFCNHIKELQVFFAIMEEIVQTCMCLVVSDPCKYKFWFLSYIILIQKVCEVWSVSFRLLKLVSTLN